MTNKRIWIVLAAAVVALATIASVGVLWWTGRPPAEPRIEDSPYVAGGAPDIVGVNYPALWSDMTPEVRANTLDTLVAAGVPWVRLDVSWAMLQPRSRDEFDLQWGVRQVDERIAEIRQRGLQILLVLYWAPEWSSGTAQKNGVPGDPADYAAAAAFAAERWGADVDAWEVWNEPDSRSFWADPSPARYGALLRAAYPAIKSVDPTATVVAGAPTYVNSEWYAELYRQPGTRDAFDAVGIHPYMSPADQTPAHSDDGTMYRLRHIDTLLDVMRANGDGDKPIWATEVGWSVHGNTESTQPWARGVSEQDQARYLTYAFGLLKSYPSVKAVFWYSVRDSKIPDEHVGSFGLLRLDGTPRPAFDALRNVLGAAR